jgi:hypothetical protein
MPVDLNFDARSVPPPEDFEPLPPGWYVAQIIGSEGKPTKAGDGGYLELKFQIMEGEFKNRIVFDRLNLENKNEQTVDIAKRQLRGICDCIGVVKVPNTAVMHGKPLLIKLVIRPATEQYGATNDVKSYKPVPGTATAGQGVGGNAQGVPNWAGGGAAPAAETVAPADPPPATTGNFTFGGIGKGTTGASASPAPAADAPTPKWAQPAGAQ